MLWERFKPLKCKFVRICSWTEHCTLKLWQNKSSGRKTRKTFSQDFCWTGWGLQTLLLVSSNTRVLWEPGRSSGRKHYLHHRRSLGLSSHWQPHKACPETDDSATKTTQVAGYRPPGAGKHSHLHRWETPKRGEHEHGGKKRWETSRRVKRVNGVKEGSRQTNQRY